MENKSSVANKIRTAYEEFGRFTTSKQITNICIPNCNVCCKDYFYISEFEFLYLLKFISENKLNLSKYKYLSREYANYFSVQHPNQFMELEKYMPMEQILADHDFQRYHDLPLCIFWEKGKGCTVYNARPSVCRWFGSCIHCDFISHVDVGKDAVDKLYTATSNVYNKKKNTVIAHRSYPIFYWFYKFLSSSHMEIIDKKVKLLSSASEEKFTDFELSLM